MRKSALVLGAAAVAALVGSTAAAGVIGIVTQLGVPDDAELGPLMGYHAYKLTVQSTDSSKITAVDFTNVPAAEGKSVESPTPMIHQRWDRLQSKNKTSTFYTTISGDNFQSADSYDSHFIIPANSYTILAEENNDGATSPFAAEHNVTQPYVGLYGWYGGGTYMRAAWGLPLEMRNTTVDVAYLVLRDADVYSGNWCWPTPKVAVASPSYGEYTAYFPEPGASALLVFLLPVLLQRRRRRFFHSA